MRLALLLMDHFGVSEGLVGDLIEERSRERSALGCGVRPLSLLWGRSHETFARTSGWRPAP